MTSTRAGIVPPARTIYTIEVSLARALRIAAVAVLLPPAAFVVTDHAVYHYERQNAFCVSCHLHQQLLARFEGGATQAVDLAGVHFAALDEPRCIACHKGEGTIERAKVLAVAAWDAVEYVAGDRHEPDHSHVPIADAGCTHCHTGLGRRAGLYQYKSWARRNSRESFTANSKW